jgi:hypothetical protein
MASLEGSEEMGNSQNMDVIGMLQAMYNLTEETIHSGW